MSTDYTNVKPTAYKGITFRSRLEARWAVFFDNLGIRWEYEPEGFEFYEHSSNGSNKVSYLPDFFLPTFNGGMYVEVKPIGGDFSKAISFSDTLKKPIMLAEGQPDYRVYKFSMTLYKPHLEWLRGIPNADQASSDNRMFAEPGYENSDGYVDARYFRCLGPGYVNAVTKSLDERFGVHDGDHKRTPKSKRTS